MYSHKYVSTDPGSGKKKNDGGNRQMTDKMSSEEYCINESLMCL